MVMSGSQRSKEDDVQKISTSVFVTNFPDGEGEGVCMIKIFKGDVEGESDREEVPETKFEEVPNKSIFEGNSVRQDDDHSEDPFGIYEVLNKKKDGKILMTSMKIALNIHLGRWSMRAWDNMFMSGWRFLMAHMSPHVLDILRSRKYLVKVGVWVSSGKRLLIISVYAPQDLSEKRCYGIIYRL
nr:RNA-directed DNA polymerase, eukaryota, reverse transcriptase zinc-binding domain protein [Tanacetum cinerariifolium]